MNEKRISELLDMATTHIVYGRTMKALKITQYLRAYFGMHMANINIHTGHKK